MCSDFLPNHLLPLVHPLGRLNGVIDPWLSRGHELHHAHRHRYGALAGGSRELLHRGNLVALPCGKLCLRSRCWGGSAHRLGWNSSRQRVPCLWSPRNPEDSGDPCPDTGPLRTEQSRRAGVGRVHPPLDLAIRLAPNDRRATASFGPLVGGLHVVPCHSLWSELNSRGRNDSTPRGCVWRPVHNHHMGGGGKGDCGCRERRVPHEGLHPREGSLGELDPTSEPHPIVGTCQVRLRSPSPIPDLLRARDVVEPRASARNSHPPEVARRARAPPGCREDRARHIGAPSAFIHSSLRGGGLLAREITPVRPGPPQKWERNRWVCVGPELRWLADR